MKSPARVRARAQHRACEDLAPEAARGQEGERITWRGWPAWPPAPPSQVGRSRGRPT